MSGFSRRDTERKIKNCRQLVTSRKVISCLEELFKNTNDSMVAYELGREYEKLGKNKNAVEYYELAESLFKLPIYKNMARAAINSLVIEALVASKRKRGSKLSQ